MNQMGNLEKLGILVIVILVVVVGVVAITPKEQIDEAIFTPPEGAVPAPLDPVADGGAAPVADGGAAPSDAAWPLDSANRPAPGTTPASEGTPAPGTSLGSTPPLPGPALGGGVSPAPAVAEPSEYTVVKGDTGVSIAKKALGSANRWPEIVALNPGLDARKLKIGQKIRIPAPSAAPVAVLPAPAPPGGGVAPAPAPATIVPVPQPEPVAPAVGRTYVVQRGDTLSDVARRELGSASKWRTILEANADVLRGSEVLRPGMKLRIPESSSVVSAPASATPAPSAAGGTKTYKVQSGDTLSSIASRFLGSSNRWKEILKANESVLHGSTSLRAGMELAIPDDVSAR